MDFLLDLFPACRQFFTGAYWPLDARCWSKYTVPPLTFRLQMYLTLGEKWRNSASTYLQINVYTTILERGVHFIRRRNFSCSPLPSKCAQKIAAAPLIKLKQIYLWLLRETN
jgi:hypothetical protein